MITVQELLDKKMAEFGCLLAGERGLSGSVSWVVTARPRTPALDPLRGGEIVLLPAHTLQYLGGTSALPSLLPTFHQSGASAVAIWTAPNEQVVATAGHVGLPLIRIDSASVQTVERELLDYVSSRLRQGISADTSRQSRLLDALAANLGVEPIVQMLAETIKRPAAYFPVSGAAALSAGADITLPEGFWEAVPRQQVVATPISDADNHTLWATPVIRQGTFAGALVVTADASPPLPDEISAMAQTATAIAVDTAHTDSRAATEQRLQQELFGDIFAGRGPDSVRMRATTLGVKLSDNDLVVLLAPATGGDNTLSVLQDHVISWTRRHGTLPWQISSEEILLLVPSQSRGQSSVDSLIRSVSTLPRQFVAGISDPVGSLQRIPEAVQEARVAVLASRNTTTGNVTHFSESGLYGLLAPLTSSILSRRIVRRVLEPISAYDIEHGSELISTLKVYLEHNGNTTTAARAMHMHRNSLTYRLHRIEDITGLYLSDSETRLLLSLALLVWELR